MHYELALVPVLAGYWFITHTYLLSNPYESKTYHRVFFEPALTGGCLLAPAWILVRIVEENFESGGPLHYIDKLWRDGNTPEYGSVLIVTVLLAIVLPYIYNLKVSKAEAASRWALINETPRGRLLRESFEMSILLEIKMDDGQSFIGFPVEAHNIRGYEGDVMLDPLFCGHRDLKTNQLNLTSKYTAGNGDDIVVLLLDKTVSVSKFIRENTDINWYV